MKTPIRRLDSLTHNDTAATKLINDNFEALQQGVEDALSRSGKKPNFMDDVLDMNMHRIINIADPIDDYDLANKHYVDTKVAEEETRAKAAEQAEKEARIAADNVLDGKITAEANRAKGVEGTLSNLTTTAKSNLVAAINEVDAHADSISSTISGYGNIVTHNVSEFATAAQGAKADTAVQPADIGNGTITLTQGGTTKGTFTTNQSGNTTIDLDAGGGGSSGIANSIIIRDISASSFTSTPATADVPAIYFAHIDVSAYVEDDKKYVPFVEYISDGGAYSRLDIIQNMASDCYYQHGSKLVSLRFYNEDVWHSAKYNVFLLEVEDDTNYVIRGMTNGLDGVAANAQITENLVTSISGSSTDTQYPSAKCVYDIVGDIETLLQSV